MGRKGTEGVAGLKATEAAGELKVETPNPALAGLEGSALLRKALFLELTRAAAGLAKDMVGGLGKMPAANLKLVLDWIREYERGETAPVSEESLGELLVRALREEAAEPGDGIAVLRETGPA